MGGQRQHILPDVNGNTLAMGKKKGSLPSRERVARFMLKIVLRDFSQHSIAVLDHGVCWNEMACATVVFLAFASQTTVLRQRVLNQPIGVIIFATTDIIFSKF